eukprot:m.24923 g.24923  ORF g.24923 m.24923 type:complete len:56 (+) comp13124_c0_seq3:532-699(+)
MQLDRVSALDFPDFLAPDTVYISPNNHILTIAGATYVEMKKLLNNRSIVPPYSDA